MESNNIDIRTALRMAREGDREAFAVVYKEYYTPIYRYLYLRTKDAAQAEDLTQEVFLKAYASVESFKILGNEPLAYFYTIARNTAIDFSRKKKPSVLRDDDEMERVADMAPGVESMAIQKESLGQLSECLESLTDEQREVITLKFISELSNKEIAAIMGKNEAAIRQIQLRGLRALGARLKEKHGK